MDDCGCFADDGWRSLFLSRPLLVAVYIMSDLPSLPELRSKAKKLRGQQRKAWGPLAQTFQKAMEFWDAQKAEGGSFEERVEGLERTLRAAWPQERPWHYICDECSDTGAIIMNSTPATPCGRPFRLPGARPDDWTGRGRCTPNHTYLRPCFCPKGDKYRRIGEERPQQDFKSAGKGTDFKKVGR